MKVILGKKVMEKQLEQMRYYFATINKNDKSVKLVSIPRDSRVYIKSRDKYDKITHAHVFGGVRQHN